MNPDEFDLDRWLHSADADFTAAVTEDLDLGDVLTRVERRASPGSNAGLSENRLPSKAVERSRTERVVKGVVDVGIQQRLEDSPVEAASLETESAGWSSLSQTQRAVALFVSQALTNQQIAQRLHLSPHTVNYHMRRIFRKLGISSRVELARRIQGLTSVDAAPDHLVPIVRPAGSGQPLPATSMGTTQDNPLTLREREVLRIVSWGLPTDEIASRLHLSVRSVRNYLAAIVRKTGGRSRREALLIAREAKWL